MECFGWIVCAWLVAIPADDLFQLRQPEAFQILQKRSNVFGDGWRIVKQVLEDNARTRQIQEDTT
jgi:hypothetical protein